MTKESADLLRELLSTVIKGPSEHKQAYLAALKHLDSLTGLEYREALPWDLRHYLSNRSYVKALNFVDSATRNV